MASTSQEGERSPLLVTLLSSEWRSSTNRDLSTLIRELAIQLAKHPGVQVSVFLPQCSEDDKRIAASHKVQLIEAEKLVGFDPVDWLINIPEDHVMDCIIGHGVHLGRQISVIKQSHNCKWIQIVHHDPEALAMYKSDADAIPIGERMKQTEIKLCELADQVVAIGPKLATTYRLLFRSSAKDVIDLTPSIFTEFKDVKQATEERTTFWVLVIGSDDIEDFYLKGCALAAEAVAQLKEASYHLMFVCAPRGKEYEIPEKLLEHGIDRSQLTVHFFNENSETLAKLFCEVDLVIMPSRNEGFGLTALQALSAGLPVLVSSNSGLGEALMKVPYGSNCVVDSEDPKHWAGRIKAVREKDRDVRLAESKFLREKYLKKYSWQESYGILVEKMRNLVTVPQEIRAQGHRAEAAFKEAMAKGSVEVYRGRIMLIGQDRAGKTSLKKFLLGIDFDPEEKSTVGIQVDQTKFEVEYDQVKDWHRTDPKKLDLSEYREDIAKITAEHIKALEGESLETTDSVDLERELNDPSRLHDVIVLPKIEEDAEESAPDSNQTSKAEIDPSTSNVQQNDISSDRDVQLIIDTTAGLTLEDVTEKVERCLQDLELNDDVKAKEVILSVWDFAGQNLYYASHSVFLSPRAVYVLVHNLSKDLNALAKSYAEDKTGEIELENPTNQTNLDNLLSWLVSVHCIRTTSDEASEFLEKKEGKCPTYLRPPVFVVGTYADKPFKDIRDTLQYIQDSISGKKYDEHVIRPLYAVDNTRSAGDYGVQALQNRILEVLKEEPYMGEKVPIRWFHFEKVVEALVENKIYHMELNELLKHTKRYCHIDKEDELKTMLTFYHDLGVIVKHGRTVVLQATWLIELFKKLIKVRPYDERDPRYSGCWQELKEKGILRMDLVDHVFTDIIQKDISKEDILKMMEDYGLIAKFSFIPADGDHQQEYFVPSLLKSLPLDLYAIKPSNCDPCPLYLHFLDDFVPHGFFAQLVSRCIVWCSGCSPEIPELYQNGAMFFFIGKQRIFDLVLIHRKRFIKIILTRNPQASAPSDTYSATKAREVRVFLEGTLKDMSEKLSWLRNLRCELCVACTHCLKRPDQCSKHSSALCADDDCLHLLPLRPEERLICRKNYARQPIKIYGLEKWLLVHEKESEERKMVSGDPKGPAVTQKRKRVFPASSVKVPKLTRPVVKRKRELPGSSCVKYPRSKHCSVAVKEGSPNNDDLERLANQIIDEWKTLGRRLLGSDDEALLCAIDKDNDKSSEKAYKMLLAWKAAKGSDATFRVLYDGLCHDVVNRRDLAEKFCLVTYD